MAISHLLAPIPFWVLLDLNGQAAGGAYLYTRSSLNPAQDKPVYKDAGGQVEWTNPVIFNANGTQGPFYWKVDSTNLNDNYFLQAYNGDKDAGGVLLWEIPNFFPPGSGGGGNTNTYVTLKNYVTNNQFIDHIENITGTLGPTTGSLPTNLVIAPSNHKGFTPALINPTVATPYGALGPDIRFCKNTLANADSITFPEFPLGDASFTPDNTPVDYVRYVCTTSNPGETFKYFQFPITQKVQNLSLQTVTFVVWAKVNITPKTIQVGTLQYFGYNTGTGASAPVLTYSSTVMNLTTVWTKQVVTFTVPDVGTGSLGLTSSSQTNDDALYLVLGMPMNQQCDIWFTMPALYLGAFPATDDFDNYDQINSINSTPRTGDIKVTYVSDPAATAPVINGWVPMDDGSIGNPSSNATTRANKDTFQLYKTIWDSVSNQWAPVQDSTGVFLISRAASAQDDFLANHRLVLPRSLGRALAGAGTGSGLTARALGEYLGSEIIDINAMPAHTHTGLFQASGNSTTGPGAFVAFNNVAVSTGSTGGGAADGNMEPTSFMMVYLKL